MSVIKLKQLLIGAIALAGVIASLVIRHSTTTQFRARQAALVQQNTELRCLAEENQRLSKRLLEAGFGTNHPSRDHSAELASLRNEADVLRARIRELARAAANQAPRPLFDSTAPASRTAPHSGFVVSESHSEDYKEKLYKIGASSPHFGPFNIDARKDAQNLGQAVAKYARDHDGELPSSFELAAPYFLERYRVPSAGDYEIVYHGSLNELVNIPGQAVALIRERQPWPTPEGKLGRIYVMANGSVKFVEASDNFQSWEAEHIVPPHRP